MLEKILEHFKIPVVALHLEGSALCWHRNFLKLKGRITRWEEYVGALRGRFGSLTYDDSMADLKKLKQIRSLQDYLKSFDMLLDKAQLGKDQALSCFLAGLKPEMELMVRMFNPRSLFFGQTSGSIEE